MAIYIATDSPLPTIPYNEKNRKLNTEDITENEIVLTNLFSKPYIKYIGSDEGCGCGFRHAILNDDNWLEVVDDEETPFENNNHIDFVDLIYKSNLKGTTVEILACWEGDQNEPIKYWQTINLSDILNTEFYFKERGFYTVQT